jgi:AraC-like DNA-binding protein
VDPAGTGPARARAARHAAAREAPRGRRAHRGAPRRQPEPGTDGSDRPLSTYCFARQLEAAAGLPPHQHIIAQSVERTKRRLQGSSDLSLAELAELAAHAGFSDQSRLTRHFERPVGVTPGQFRRPARSA